MKPSLRLYGLRHTFKGYMESQHYRSFTPKNSVYDMCRDEYAFLHILMFRWRLKLTNTYKVKQRYQLYLPVICPVRKRIVPWLVAVIWGTEQKFIAEFIRHNKCPCRIFLWFKIAEYFKFHVTCSHDKELAILSCAIFVNIRTWLHLYKDTSFYI